MEGKQGKQRQWKGNKANRQYDGKGEQRQKRELRQIKATEGK